MNFATLAGKFACIALRKHKRGKRVGPATDIVNGMTNFYCPRCGTRWARKDKAKK